MPQASTITRAKQQKLQQIERRLEVLQAELKAKLLVDDEAAIAKLILCPPSARSLLPALRLVRHDMTSSGD